MSNLEYMLDSYQKSGTSIEGYMTEAERFDKNTEMVHGNLGTMSIMHLTNVISERKKEQLVYVLLSPVNARNMVAENRLCLGEIYRVNCASVKEKFPEFYKEQIDYANTAFYREKRGKEEMFFIGKTFQKTFSAKIKELGGGFLKESSLERDLALTRLFTDKPVNGYFVVRSAQSLRKIMSVFSKNYRRINFSTMGEAAELVQGYSIKKWNITQQAAEIYLEADDCESDVPLIPGIRLITSDTGYLSTCAQSYFRNRDGAVSYLVETYTLNHSSEVNADVFLKEVDKVIEYNRVFLKKLRIQRNAMKLVKVDCYETYKRIVKELLNMAGAEGEKNRQTIENQLLKNYVNQYNKEDVFDTILTLPEVTPNLTMLQKNYIRDILPKIICESA